MCCSNEILNLSLNLDYLSNSSFNMDLGKLNCDKISFVNIFLINIVQTLRLSLSSRVWTV